MVPVQTLHKSCHLHDPCLQQQNSDPCDKKRSDPWSDHQAAASCCEVWTLS
jgi:hypothetical protein